jgi:methylated-DNA-protein-cysteine methyltransferase-like protein
MTTRQTGRLSAQVYALVRACPRGRVTTYGWLAGAVGYPRGGRVIGWIMSATPAHLEVPAHRVINRDGILTGRKAFGAEGRMRTLLENEGVKFEPDGHVDMKRFGWDPQLDLSPDELREILESVKPMQAQLQPNCRAHE